jgi:outer membrane protein
MTTFYRGFSLAARKCAVAGLSYLCSISLIFAQNAGIEPIRPKAPIVVRPYLAPTVPPVRLGNSPRLRDLVRAGILYLTAQDAIALALENNIDIEVARYGPVLAAWNLERAQAGGALPGVPSGASFVGSVASGQGVAGSQAAAGVTTGFAGLASASATNATVSEVGVIAQTLDPSFQESSVFSHQTTPEQDEVQSIIPVLISNTRAYSATYQQGFLIGGSVTVGYKDSYLNENAPTDVLNPSSAPSLSISYQQNLLRGFGVAVNARTINVSKLNVQASDLNFKTQVINTTVSVLNQYYQLAADYQDLNAKKRALEVAQQLNNDNKIQEQLGRVTPLDVTNSETQVASSENDVVASQANLQLHEVQFKNLLSRTGVADPLLASVQIIPLDKIVVPQQDNLPPIKTMVQQALENRSDLASERLGLISSEISAIGTKNAVLPSLQVFLTESDAGLEGAARTADFHGHLLTADPYFVGGIGTALSQLFQRNFPTNRIANLYQGPLRNRQAQADSNIDQLSLRQAQLAADKDVNEVTVDVSNYAVAVRQARARYQAAVQSGILQQQLLDAEQKKFAAGLSTPYNVILEQRDLETAQATEISTLVAYSNARVALDQILGITLETNHISIDEARDGKVARPSSLPAELPSQP